MLATLKRICLLWMDVFYVCIKKSISLYYNLTSNTNIPFTNTVPVCNRWLHAIEQRLSTPEINIIVCCIKINKLNKFLFLWPLVDCLWKFRREDFLFLRNSLEVHFSMALPLMSQQAKFCLEVQNNWIMNKSIPFLCVQKTKKEEKRFHLLFSLVLISITSRPSSKSSILRC